MNQHHPSQPHRKQQQKQKRKQQQEAMHHIYSKTIRCNSAMRNRIINKMLTLSTLLLAASLLITQEKQQQDNVFTCINIMVVSSFTIHYSFSSTSSRSSIHKRDYIKRQQKQQRLSTRFLSDVVMMKNNKNNDNKSSRSTSTSTTTTITTVATKSQQPRQRRSKSDAVRTSNSEQKQNLFLQYTTRYYAVQALLPISTSTSTNNNNIEGSFAVDRLESIVNTMSISSSSSVSSLSNTLFTTRDRAFCRLLVTTVERRMGQLDSIIDEYSKHKQQDQDQPQTVEHQRTIKVVPKKKSRADLLIQTVLRVGAVQLLFLNVPSYAAVKETIDVLRMFQQSQPQSQHNNINDDTTIPNNNNNNNKNYIYIPEAKIKYVNAILRRIDREGQNELLSLASDVTLNVSPYLVQESIKQWGIESSYKIFNAAMKESPRSLTINCNNKLFNDISPALVSNQDKIEWVAQQLSTSTNNDTDSNDSNSSKNDPIVHILPNGSIVVPTPPSGTLSSWPLYNTGVWWCQDPSATIPAIALYNTLSSSLYCNPTTEINTMTVVDLCSSPGGKTAQLSSYGFGTVYAIEISNKRYNRLKNNMDRLNMNWNIVVADGTTWQLPTATGIEENYGPESESKSSSSVIHGILVDVPCTATGTGSKRPDVLRRIQSSDSLTELLDTQYRLLNNAIDNRNLLKRRQTVSTSTTLDVSGGKEEGGGIIVYSTCSILQQEGEEQILRILQERPNDIRIVPFSPGEIPGFDQYIDPKYGWIRILPGHHGTNNDNDNDNNDDDNEGHDNNNNNNNNNYMESLSIDGFFVARLERI